MRVLNLWSAVENVYIALWYWTQNMHTAVILILKSNHFISVDADFTSQLSRNVMTRVNFRKFLTRAVKYILKFLLHHYNNIYIYVRLTQITVHPTENLNFRIYCRLSTENCKKVSHHLAINLNRTIFYRSFPRRNERTKSSNHDFLEIYHFSFLVILKQLFFNFFSCLIITMGIENYLSTFTLKLFLNFLLRP